MEERNIKEYRVFLLPTLVLMGVTLSFFFILKPKIEEVLDIQKRLAQEKKRLAKVTQKLTALEGLSEYELSTKTQYVLKVLPVEKDVAGNLWVIRSLVQAEGLGLGDVKVEPGLISTESGQPRGIKKHKTPFLEFKVTISGDLGSIRDFLAKIESVAPLMRMKEVNISQTSQKTAKASFFLRSFYLPLPKTLGSLEKPLPVVTHQEEAVYNSLSKIEIIETEKELAPVQSGKDNPFVF